MKKEKGIPLISWNGKGAIAGTRWDRVLEKSLGEKRVVVRDTQTAVQMCIELLGAGPMQVPVVAPVTLPPDALSALLRAGAKPILLDITEDTLQINLEQLNAVMEEVDEFVAYLPRPVGKALDAELVEALGDHPIIEDTRVPPGEGTAKGHFVIYDLLSVIGTGAVIMQPFDQQHTDLLLLKGGTLGHNAALPEILAGLAHQRLAEQTKVIDHQKKMAVAYVAGFKDAKRDDLLVEQAYEESFPFFTVKATNAKKVIAHLDSYGVQASLAFCPVHTLDHIKDRWEEEPSYPVAEALSQQLVVLPTHRGVSYEDVAFIIEKIMEVE